MYLHIAGIDNDRLHITYPVNHNPCFWEGVVLNLLGQMCHRVQQPYRPTACFISVYLYS